MTTESGQRTPLTRRRLLGGALAVGTTTALAGCGDPGVRGAGPSDKKEPRGDFTLPEPVVSLPSKDVTFRLVDSNDTKAPFWRQLFQAYQEKHPNIRCQYDGLPWAKIEEVVPLGIRNKTAHDVIQLPGNVPLDQAVANGWVAPLDDLLPDIEKWKASFPELSYVEGSRVF
ncbi:MAG TPA: extracellular solute-binding protein, partial [Actinopolymorphaceae bacterium]